MLCLCKVTKQAMTPALAWHELQVRASSSGNGASSNGSGQYDFDLFTIGAGSGGVRAARYAASTFGALRVPCAACTQRLPAWPRMAQPSQLTYVYKRPSSHSSSASHAASMQGTTAPAVSSHAQCMLSNNRTRAAAVFMHALCMLRQPLSQVSRRLV